MYIESVEGWYDVGYLEDSLEVPGRSTLPEEVEKKVAWKYEKGGLSVDRLFSGIRIPIKEDRNAGLVYQDVIGTKYLRVRYSDLDYVCYGWVDDVSLISKKVVFVSWHLDYWRTYIGKFKVAGKLSRRPIRTINNQYQNYHIPTAQFSGGIEACRLEGQFRGLAWIIITYLPGDGLFSSLVDAGINLVPGATPQLAIGKKVAQGAVSLIKSLPNSFARATESPMEANKNSDIGVATYKGSWMDYLICAAFPVSVNATQSLYIRSITDGTWFASPTLRDVCDGVLSTTMGIEPSRLISAFISPVCPLHLGPMVDKDGNIHDGIDTNRALVLDRGNNPYYVEYGARQEIGEFHESQGKVWVTIPRAGMRYVGDLEGDSPLFYLSEILDTYYTGFADIPEVKFGKYTIKIKRPAIYANAFNIHGCKAQTAEKRHVRFRLARLLPWLKRATSNWKTVTMITDNNLVYKYMPEQWIGDPVRYHMLWTQYSGEPEPRPMGWKCMKTVEDDKITYTLSYDCSDWEFIDFGIDPDVYDKTSVDERPWMAPDYILRFIDCMYGEYDRAHLFYNDYNDFGGVLKSREIDLNWVYIPIEVVETGSTEYHWHPLEKLGVNNVDGCGHYKISKMWSLSGGWIPMAFVQSITTTWPILRGSLDKTYYCDENHDLVIIGPNGNIVYRFKTGSGVRDYTYQTVVSGSIGYIKIRFMGYYPYASDNEVHIPLSTCPTTASYSNPWGQLDSLTQQYQKQMYQDTQISEQRKLENEQKETQRKESEATITATYKQRLVEFANEKTTAALNKIKGWWDSWWGTNDKDPSLAGQISDAIGTAANKQLMHDPHKVWEAQDALTEKARTNADKDRNRMRNLDNILLSGPSTTMFASNDLSWFHEYGEIEFVYINRDDASSKEFWKTVGKIGISCNEYVTSEAVDKIIENGGPMQMSEAIVSGTELSRSAITYIRSRLEGGVCIDRTL